jgi:hypothetical protein
MFTLSTPHYHHLVASCAISVITSDVDLQMKRPFENLNPVKPQEQHKAEMVALTPMGHSRLSCLHYAEYQEDRLYYVFILAHK